MLETKYETNKNEIEICSREIQQNASKMQITLPQLVNSAIALVPSPIAMHLNHHTN